jgi:hypothetical protein
LKTSAYTTGNATLGRGDRGPLPVHLILQTKAFTLIPAIPRNWELVLSAD